MRIEGIVTSLERQEIDEQEYNLGLQEIIKEDTEFASFIASTIDGVIEGKHYKILVGKKVQSMGAFAAAIIGILRMRQMEGVVDVRFSEPSRLVVMGPNKNPSDEDKLRVEEYKQRKSRISQAAREVQTKMEGSDG